MGWNQVIAFSDACVRAVQMIEQENVEVCVIGNTDSACFPAELFPYTDRKREPVCGKDKLRVNLLINYGMVSETGYHIRGMTVVLSQISGRSVHLETLPVLQLNQVQSGMLKVYCPY